MEFRVLCIYVWALGMVVFLGMVVWSLILGVDLYNLRPRFNSVRVVQWCLVQRWRNLVMPYRGTCCLVQLQLCKVPFVQRHIRLLCVLHL